MDESRKKHKVLNLNSKADAWVLKILKFSLSKTELVISSIKSL